MEPGNEPGAGTREVPDGLNVDPEAHGQVTGLDIDPGSKHLDRATLETVQLSLKATNIALGRGPRGLSNSLSRTLFCYNARPDPPPGGPRPSRWTPTLPRWTRRHS